MRTSKFDLGEFGIIDVYAHDYIIHNSIKSSGELWCKNLFDFIIDINQVTKPTLVDVGAHCGLFSIPFCKITGGTAISFEPQENLFELLNKNFSQNSLENYETHNCAVGSLCKSGISLNKGDEGYAASNKQGLPSNLGGVGIGEDGESGIEMVTIDSMNLTACDVLKIDVEGAEPYVIDGARETISKYKPIIMYENNWKTTNDYMKKLMGEPMNIKEFLLSLGYSFEDKDVDVIAYIKK